MLWDSSMLQCMLYGWNVHRGRMDGRINGLNTINSITWSILKSIRTYIFVPTDHPDRYHTVLSKEHTGRGPPRTNPELGTTHFLTHYSQHIASHKCLIFLRCYTGASMVGPLTSEWRLTHGYQQPGLDYYQPLFTTKVWHTCILIELNSKWWRVNRMCCSCAWWRDGLLDGWVPRVDRSHLGHRGCRGRSLWTTVNAWFTRSWRHRCLLGGYGVGSPHHYEWLDR